jgi:acyl carrier protein
VNDCLTERYVFPASFAQQRLWFVCQLNPDAHLAYQMSVAFTVAGKIDPDLLCTALAALVERHEILRTRFVLFDEAAERFGGELCQVIEPAGPFPVARRVVTEEELDRALAEEEPFALDALPLAGMRLFDLPGGRQVLQLLAHHLIFDGWSVEVFLDELAATYAAAAEGRAAELPELLVQYADFSEWQRDRIDELDADLDRWQEWLSGVPPLELPTDRPRPDRQSFRGARTEVWLPPRLAERVNVFAAAERATSFMVLLAAWQVALACWSGQRDFAIGTPVAGRNRPELERSIGLFVNTVVLRADLSGRPAFREIVRRTRAITLDCFARQEVPFERIVQRVVPGRDLRRSPLVQVLFSLQNAPSAEVELPGARVTLREVPRHTAMFDLRLSLRPEADTLTGWLEYNRDLFDEATARHLLGQWRDLLDEVLDAADRPVEFGADNPGSVPAAGPTATEADEADEAGRPAAPRTRLEADLLAIFRQLLGQDDVNINTSFFDCGGNSLLAVRAMRQIRQTLRASVPVETIFSLTSVAQLAKAIEAPETMAAIPDSEAIMTDVNAMWQDETKPSAPPGKDSHGEDSR